MNAGLIIAIIAIPVAVGLLIFFVLRKKKKADVKPEDADLQVFSNVIEYTPKGAKVCSLQGVTDEFKNWIDAALDELFLDAAAEGYVQWLSYEFYQIYALHTCKPAPESGVMSFLIRADNYDQTLYDQDGRPGIGKVFAAEMVMPEMTGEFVVCISDREQEVKDAVRFGAEHLILFANDRAKYEATKTHYSGGHPLIARSI